MGNTEKTKVRILFLAVGAGMKDWKKVINVKMPEVGPITKKSIDETKKNSHRFRGSTRVSTGRVWTDREYEIWREKVLNTPLP